MCETCETVPPGRRARRAGLSDIDQARHCAIIGTCLSLPELRSIANKFDGYVRPGASDYDLHSTVVHRVMQDRKLAKVLTKMLDRKYAMVIARFAKAEREEEVLSAWTDSFGRGDIAGGLWAVLSHPHASESVCARVYGEVHMLSHQVSAVVRSDIKATHALETANRELRQEVASLRGRQNEMLSARDAEIQDLRLKLEAETSRANRLARAEDAAAELEALRKKTAELEARLKVERGEHEALEAQWRVAEAARRETERRIQALTDDNDSLRREMRLAEARLAGMTPALTDGLGGCDASCRDLDLCGRCILVVGGRNQHVPHLRQIVEASNGTFAHHDGGLEESLGLLPGLVGRADAVLFAVDNISHAAQDELKRHCRRQDRLFLPVRRSGLGAYLSALQTLAEPGDAEVPPVKGQGGGQ